MHTELRNFSNFIFLTLVFLFPTKITLAEDKSEETQQVILALFAAFIGRSNNLV